MTYALFDTPAIHPNPRHICGLRGHPAVRRQGKADLDEAVAGQLWDATADLVGAVAR